MARKKSAAEDKARLRFDDGSITRRRIKQGTFRRILPYALTYPWPMTLLVISTVVDAAATAAGPLLLKMVIDDGILPGRTDTVIWLCLGVTGLALVEGAAMYVQAWASGRIGEGVVYDLRNRVFTHIQKQSLTFFTRAQTGALVSRLNTDVVGARQAVTVLLSQTLSVLLSLALVLAAMFYLSWQITLAALAMIPLFLLPARLVSGRLQRLTRERMELDGDMSSLMSERFNVSGAMLAKLYGRVEDESGLFARKAGRVRDIAVLGILYGRTLSIVGTVLTAITTALVYGLGGVLTIDGTLALGTLVAMVALLMRLYGPINQLSSMQATVMTALVSFDRVFEVLDLEPNIAERPGARDLADARPAAGSGEAPDITFEGVSFRYPSGDEAALASLGPAGGDRPGGADEAWTLQNLDFHAPAGKLTALVGPSGAGKTTITQLVPRLYDPDRGTVRIAGQDVRDLTLQSLRDTIGVVTQDAHLFHDTLRANLEYARPGASEQELIDACEAALIWDTVRALPDGLDTLVGDRGYRLSGGEKQRIALARLLLKAPSVVVLDEATAHLDSDSEAAIQRALKTALAGRTSLVIAHRLSTIREADRILVVEAGQIREQGTHKELLAADGLYAALYRTQFAQDEPLEEAAVLDPA
ncbi:ABC transporter ATP-binding protein [Streptomyces avidinii]|uniref:ATP-binding cassette subfamily B protein n=1 Tax=Streptomyces avidinii TaxID=1895 RepID=A0ABS4LHH3_STRAV|nr:ABC transporter ATP-binding protein [Streptomyces avidinii]MBP2041491.1 ATP-binding cassette subfamily B protein [Streptomyces avidinii]GGZ34632.1 ABC transporter [Streptomyces avidinii]